MKPVLGPWRIVMGTLFFLALAELYSLLPPRDTETARAGGVESAAPGSPGGFAEAPPVPYRQGILHVHSSHSGNGGSVDDIARAAQACGMDFVVLTDTGTAAARGEGAETTYGSTDLFVEMEATTPAGHALVFYSHTEAASLPDDQVESLAWKHFLGEATTPGVFVVTAHPSHIKNPWSRLDRFPDGVEVVNFDAVWRRLANDSVAQLALVGAIYPFNNYLGGLRFLEPYSKDFVAWDGMNELGHKHFAVLGHDARARLMGTSRVGVRWPSYRTTFQLASNIVYPEGPPAADLAGRKKQIYDAIRNGRLALAFHAVHPFAGNDWSLRCPEKTFRPGDTAPADKRCDFFVQVPAKLPYRAVIRLIRNGELLQEIPAEGPGTTVALESEGTYRVEVWARARSMLRVLLDRPVPYVFYNPIYVR